MICAACARPTSGAPMCTHCGAAPLVDGRFALQMQVRADLRGVLYDALDGETPVRLRLSDGPPESDSIAWGEAAERWRQADATHIAAPVAWGELPDGRWYRAEAAMDATALRRGGSEASVLALVDSLLASMAELHAAGVTHGGLSAQCVVRSVERGLVLVDFGPNPGTPADDVLAIARLAEAVAPDPFDASINAVLHRMRAPDPANRPTAGEALQALREAGKWRRAPTLPVEPPRSSVGPLLLLLLAAAAVWYWTQSDDEPEFWQGVLTGEVWRTSGDAPVASGRSCEVEVTAQDRGRHNCQVRVQCGETIVYGGEYSGYATCSGTPVRAQDVLNTDKDSDPRLDLTAARGQLLIADERHGAWSVTIGLNIELADE